MSDDLGKKIRTSSMSPYEIDHKLLYEKFKDEEQLLSFFLSLSDMLSDGSQKVMRLINHYKMYSLHAKSISRDEFLDRLNVFSSVYFGNRCIIHQGYVITNPIVSRRPIMCGNWFIQVLSENTCVLGNFSNGELTPIDI